MPDSAQVSHPGVSQLAAFALGKLASGEHAALQAHLAHCQTCQEALASLQKASPEPPTQEGGSVRAREQNTPAPASAAQPSPDADVPTDLADHPRYEILQLLGQGGMGAVYKARHKVMDRVVALKVINATLLGSSTAVERFQREVKAAAKLHHPNIVTAHDADQAGATHFLVMELVEGTDLAKYVEQKGPLPVADACHFIRQAALGLQHAHEHGMVHRDIKPHNLMLMAGGVVKLMDFGLARLAQEGANTAGLTGENVVMGTVDYIAPEQAQDAHKADIRADIYSLGCALYHLLAGQPPFRGKSVVEKLAGHLMGVPPMGELPAPAPAGLQTVLARMLAKDPSQRYQTPAEVAQALEPFMPKVSGAKAPPPDAVTGPIAGKRQISSPGSWRGKRWWRWLAGGVALLLVVAATSALLLRPGGNPASEGHQPSEDGPPAAKQPGPLPPRFTNRLGMEFVRVPRGKFLMGGGAGKVGEKTVEIPHEFYLGVYELTQEEWQAVMGGNPSHFSRLGAGHNAVKDIPDAELKRFPVERVSWEDAQEFLALLNHREKEGGWLYRLPKETEWEYACRGGPPANQTDSACDFYFEKPANLLLPDQANFNHENSLNRPCKVGSYPPNRLGLYDMHGNVREWCDDAQAAKDEPSRRVLRGGSWYFNSNFCRAGYRFAYPPALQIHNIGLRLARVPVGTEGK